ncbi:MAG: prolyl oligopeptidase family serine peptidase, partial [Candidatus Dormibacteria bacterium]
MAVPTVDQSGGWRVAATPPSDVHLDGEVPSAIYHAAGDGRGRLTEFRSPVAGLPGDLLSGFAGLVSNQRPVLLDPDGQLTFSSPDATLTWSPTGYGLAVKIRAAIPGLEFRLPLASVDRVFDDRDLTVPGPQNGDRLLTLHRYDHLITDWRIGSADMGSPFMARSWRVLLLESSVTARLDDAGWAVPVPAGEEVRLQITVRWPLISTGDTYPTHDGQDQWWRVVRPPDLPDDREAPLFVGLHGGNEALDNFMILSHPSWSASIKFALPMLLGARMIVPNHNDADGTATGERQPEPGLNGPAQDAYVLDAIEEAARRFAVDRRRIYAMGISNGGNAALTSACLHPDKFALAIAVVPATDWSAQFPVGDLASVLPDHEQFSPINTAENLLHVPVSMRGCAADALDGRVQVGRMADRLMKLGYRFVAVVTEIGHHVDYETIEGGYEQGLELALERPAVPASPQRVVFRTRDLRWPGAYWLRIERLAGEGFGLVDADRGAGGRILRVHATNVSRIVVDAVAADLNPGLTSIVLDSEIPCDVVFTTGETPAMSSSTVGRVP